MLIWGRTFWLDFLFFVGGCCHGESCGSQALVVQAWAFHVVCRSMCKRTEMKKQGVEGKGETENWAHAVPLGACRAEMLAVYNV